MQLTAQMELRDADGCGYRSVDVNDTVYVDYNSTSNHWIKSFNISRLIL